MLTIDRKPDSRVIELLEANIIGTPGESMVYRHQNVRSKVNAIPDAYFANLSIRNRLYGTICLIKRNVHSRGKLHQAFYLRYFTFRAEFRTIYPKNHKRKTPSKVREEVIRLMNGEGLDYSEELTLYAYVDPENTRSKRLIEEFGFIKMGKFLTIPFSRFFPKYYHRVEKLDQSCHDQIKNQLITFYEKEQLVSFENLFSRGDFFGIRENEEITCGVQAIPDSWKILDLPSLSGKLMMHVVPKLPVIGKLFNPDYKFVFLECMFCKQGCEKELELLLESVLATYKVSSAIICLDPRSRLYDMVQHMNLGITHKIMGEKEIDIAVKTSNQTILNKKEPFFVSGYDVL